MKQQEIRYITFWRFLSVLAILIMLLVTGCSGHLCIRVENVKTLVPVFNFFSCETCNEIRTVKISYFAVSYKDDNNKLKYAWVIKSANNKTTQYQKSLNSITYGVVPEGYEAEIEAMPLECDKQYQAGSILQDVDDSTILGANGEFSLIKAEELK